MIFIELGNSTIKLAQDFGGGTLLLERFVSATDLFARIETYDDRIVCAPVGQNHSAQILDILRRRANTFVITPEALIPFVGDTYDTPLTLGLDRALNLLGLSVDGVVISCGTAITVDACISGKPRWGAILQGFSTAAELLHDRIPALPLVDVHTQPSMPARDSVRSVVNGVVLGTARAAQAIATELVEGDSRGRLSYVLTGGDAQLLERLWTSPPAVLVDELLIFAGMAVIARSH